MDEILGLPAEVSTALTIVVTGVVIPAVTAVLKQPNLPAPVRRGIPIALAVIAAVVIVALRAGGPFAEQFITWLLVAATLVGIAQTVFSLMPGAWRGLEESTTTTSAAAAVAAEEPPAEPEGTDYSDTVANPTAGDMDEMEETDA